MTPAKKCVDHGECDTRYVMQSWFWRIITVSVITLAGGAGGVIWAGGQWKKDIENKVANIDRIQSQLIEANSKLDLLIKRTENNEE